MNSLAVFDERKVLGKDFRIYGAPEAPLFLAKDVALWIEYNQSNVHQLVSLVDDTERRGDIKMGFHNLIGFQIINLNDNQMTVQKGADIYTLDFDYDYGDCCGYARITNTLLFDSNNHRENPVITKVEEKRNDEHECESVIITLFGGNRSLAQLHAEAGSGSGWCYGACVTVTCAPLKIAETIVSW